MNNQKNNQWAVICVEQNCEDLSIYLFSTEEDASNGLEKIWKHDIEVETVESCRSINHDKSHCDEDFAELYYTNSNEPIRYFVKEIDDGKLKIQKIEKAGDL